MPIKKITKTKNTYKIFSGMILALASCGHSSERKSSALSQSENSSELNTITGRGYITGTDKPDHIIGSAFDDRVYGYGKDDVIETLSGRDVVFGGLGDDIIKISDPDELIDGGDGVDAVQLGGIYSGLGTTVDLESGKIQPTNDPTYSSTEITSIEGVIHNSDNNLVVYGTDSANKITTGFGDDIIYLKGGSDIVQSSGGDDLVFGARGYKNINTGEGSDIIELLSLSGTISGGDGHDILKIKFEALTGSILVDFSMQIISGQNEKELTFSGIEEVEITNSAKVNFVGSMRDEIMTGGLGDDVFASGGGNDAFRGQEGADTFKLSLLGKTRILDFNPEDVDIITVQEKTNYNGAVFTMAKINLSDNAVTEMPILNDVIIVTDETGFTNENQLLTKMLGPSGVEAVTSTSFLGKSAMVLWYNELSKTSILSVVSDSSYSNGLNSIVSIGELPSFLIEEFDNLSSDNFLIA